MRRGEGKVGRVVVSAKMEDIDLGHKGKVGAPSLRGTGRRSSGNSFEQRVMGTHQLP